MKFKQKVDFFSSISFILIGTFLLLLSLFNVTNIKLLNIIVFSFISLVNLIRFILVRKDKDYEGLHIFIISLCSLIFTIVSDITNIKKLYYIIMFWVGFMSLANLKKMDYYHDRKNNMWKLQAFIFGAFLLTGLLTCINLAHSSSVQIIILGYLYLTCGILKTLDPLAIVLIKNK